MARRLKLDPFERFRTRARDKWGKATPYRVGIEAGLAGTGLPNPYRPGKNAHLFDDGRKVGMLERAKMDRDGELQP